MTTRRPVPPLKALVALECVVRHGSVSLAADELCVTHGAVSKQLTSLSAWVGQPLFADNRRRMVPTPEALRLAHGVNLGLREIYDVIDEVCGTPPEEPLLRVIAPATLAMYWLIPRLPALQHSALRVRADVRYTHTQDAWQELAFDVAIRAGQDVPAGYEQAAIIRDRLGLVAAPEITRTGSCDRELAAGLPLFESSTRPGELDRWLASAGLERDDFERIESFDHNYVAIEAALSGQGAVVAPLSVVDNHLRRGSLVQIMPETTVPGPEFTAVYDSHAANARHARSFIDWLITQADEARKPGHLLSDGNAMTAERRTLAALSDRAQHHATVGATDL